MIVVADTSPLNYLIRIGHVDVLRTLYDRILVPHVVHNELLDPAAPLIVRQWAQNPPHWWELLSPRTPSVALQAILDAGEAEAITLAEELGSDWLLIDENAGRREARKRGLPIIGTLGILRGAHNAGLLYLPDALQKLTDSGFYVSAALMARLVASL